MTVRQRGAHRSSDAFSSKTPSLSVRAGNRRNGPSSARRAQKFYREKIYYGQYYGRLNAPGGPVQLSPSSARARQRILEVLPVPGGPAMMTCGMFPSRAITRSLLTVSSLPTTSAMVFGRYLSTHLRFGKPV